MQIWEKGFCVALSICFPIYPSTSQVEGYTMTYHFNDNQLDSQVYGRAKLMRHTHRICRTAELRTKKVLSREHFDSSSGLCCMNLPTVDDGHESIPAHADSVSPWHESLMGSSIILDRSRCHKHLKA